ncbi:MAG TPA: hypothetical protein VFQ44_17365 [Streptosporangiaceae bacterium]|nr:hypothetical protein [Streptosporangiaceae bacterium]
MVLAGDRAVAEAAGELAGEVALGCGVAVAGLAAAVVAGGGPGDAVRAGDDQV